MDRMAHFSSASQGFLEKCRHPNEAIKINHWNSYAGLRCVPYHVRGTNESRKAAQLKLYLWNVERKVLGVRLSVFSQSDVQIANLFRPFES